MTMKNTFPVTETSGPQASEPETTFLKLGHVVTMVTMVIIDIDIHGWYKV